MKKMVDRKREYKKPTVNPFVDVDARDTDGFTLLIKAASKGNKKLIKFLIKKGADVDAVAYYEGRTALMLAACYGHKEIVELLIKNGADVNAKDEDGWTALTWAVMFKREEVVKFLLPKLGGLEGVRRKMKEDIKQEKDPVKRLELKIELAECYREIVSCLGKETKPDVKTVRLPPKDRGTFRMKRVTNG